jgi:type IV pilus assembly protein PilV
MVLQHHFFRQQNGFSLIEVMIALLVLAVGAAGTGLLLLTSVQGTVQAQERSQAALQASELAQLIHANPAVLGHLIHGNENSPECGDEQPCPGKEWARDHLQDWQQELQQSISQARGIVCNDSSPRDGDLSDLACDGMGDAVIKIVWQEAAKNQQQPLDRQLVLPLPQP